MPDDFAPGPTHPSNAPLFAGAALLDAEKLDCYRIALEFQAIAGQSCRSGATPSFAISSIAPASRSR
jgi:hypothetical protein